jgi:hypothetical protein
LQPPEIARTRPDFDRILRNVRNSTPLSHKKASEMWRIADFLAKSTIRQRHVKGIEQEIAVHAVRA